MVFSRSDVKRKTKEVHDPLGENPKRTKVHAQRKFAQGSGMNSPIMTPIKEKEKTKPNGAPSPAELLPSKRPTTEDFLSFLCFRGTKVLPPRLDFFNEASSSERSDNVTQTNSSKQTAASPSGVQKIKPRNAGTQVFKKALADRQSGLQKGNAMRARTASDERQTLRKNRIERQLRRKAAQIRAKTIRKTHPSILKRLGANRLRAGLRSGGQLPPGSEVGLKTDRKPKRGRPKRPRIKKKMDSVPQKRLKREEEANNDESEESISEEEFQEEQSGDEETEEADKKPLKKSSMTMRTRGSSNSPAQSPKKQGVSSRPSRKTKEAATLYMEMITKDLRNPEEDDDDDDEDYVRNFPELPSVIKKEKEDEAKQRSPKRVKQEKRPSSPNKSDRGKAVKNEKVKEEDDEDNEPLLKRSQRLLQVKRISPKGKTNTKFRGRPKLKGSQIKKGEEPPKNTKDFLKKRGNRKRESKNTSDSIIDDDEEEDEGNDSSLNSRYRKGNAESSNLSKSRYSRRSDIKKNDEMNESMKDISSKKRKSTPATLSEEIDLSEEDDNIELSGSSKKVRRSADEVVETKKAKSTDQRKTKKSSIDLKQVESISKRVSTRNIKKELNESECEEEDPKEKPTTRAKRIKNESDDDVPARKSKAGRRKIKYKEETDEEQDEDEEEEEEEETPVKLRGHLQRKAKIKDEIDDIQEKNVKKYNQTQQPRAKSKDESDEEVASYSKKDRESLQRRVKNRIDNEVEFDNPVKKTREPSQRKAKNSGSENDKNTELTKLREPAQRKQKIKEESDEENEITHKKTRESSQRKVKYSYESEEEAEKIPKKLREPLERKVKNKEEESDEEIDVAPKKSRESLQRRVKNKEVSDDEITNVRKQRSSVQRKSKIKDDSDEEEIISVKKTRGSLQRKPKAKVDSDEEFDEPNPTKTREHLQRKSKNKEDYNETPQNLVDDSPSSEEDEDENAGSLRESSARKLQNRDQIKDNKTKRREQLRKSKSKSDDTESQEKIPHEVFQKTLKGKVKFEGVQSDFKKNDQQQKNISSKEQTSSKENIVDSDDNSVNLPHGSLDSNKKDEDLNEKKTDKARVQQKKVKSCTSGSETVEGKSEDVHGLTDSVGKTKKVINLGQNKDSNLEVDENVNEARKEGERSLLVDEEIEKSSKANVKNKGKKSASMNESELKEHIVKEELKQQKSKPNTSSETVDTVASIQDDQFQSKTRTSMKDNEFEDNGIKEGNSFCKEVAIKNEKESISDKQPKEFARLNKSSSKNTLSENIEEQNTQKTRTMPRRGSRKGYEESDDESDDFKIQGKQSSKMATRNENFENISDSESDGKCRGLKVIEPEEKDLLKTNEFQKKNRKSVPVNKIKKEFNEEEVNKLKVKGDEITLSSTQEEPVTSVKNEPEVPDKMFKNKNDKYIVTRNIKTEDSAAQIVEDDIAGIKQTQERELIQKDSLQKREIGTPNGDFCSQRKVETLKLDGNEQDIHQATVMKVKVEEGLKNVHEHSHKMIKEQNEAILDKKNAEKGFDDQRKISKKAKAVSNENSDGKTKFDRSSIVDYDTGQVNFSFESNLANKSNEENMESNIEVKSSTDEVAQKSSSRSGTDKINIKKGNDIDRRKFKKSSSDATLPEPRRKSRDSDRKLSKKNDEFSGVGEIKERKLDLSPEDKYKLKRSTRFSTGNHEDKLIVKISDRDSYFADIDKTLPFDRSDSSPIPPRTSVRKPSLNARAIEREDVKSNDLAKVPASIKRKSVGERDSCDTIGSGSSGIVDCKVVLEALGNIPSDSYKHSKKIKNNDKHASGKTVGTKTSEEPLVKSKNSSISNKPSCLETSETLSFEVKKEISEKQVSKPSISETWRQAFKNAKIPKPGHLSPVQHSVKPFVRQKLPGSPLLSTTFQGKGSDGTETKAQEVNKSKVTSSLSPFKSLIANQNQQSLSPDAKRHSSPAHKVGSAGYESPLRRNDDIKVDFRKQEAPVKSLTQLQYEKRSSEFISSLESGPPVLPGFESIRAYKKEMKKEEPKEIKTEVLDTPAPPEAIVKPSTEGKHLNLPLAVEHTLRKMSPITVSKKPPAKPITVKTETLPLTKIVPPTVACEKKIAVEPVPSPAPVNPSPGGQLGPPNDLTIRDSSDLSFLAKKKVNMTAEEIERWLSDSTSNGVEHKKDCGIFENNQCECSYRTSGASMQNSVGTSELVAKDDGKIDHGVVEPPVQLKELDKHGKYVAETISTCKVEEYKEKLLSKTNVSENKMAPPKSWKSSGQEKFKSNRSMTEEEMCEYDFRFDKMSNSPRESVSDVSSVTHRDDASSSSEVPERKIFHQKRERCRDAPGPKRPSISSPTAFSAENESSVYAFKPDPPSHTNRPFRRGRGKSGEPDDRKGMSSSSVAVQVNLKESLESESEAVLECSTQTERPNDDNEGHLFYIPLPDEQLQSGLPHGVAVKLDTEGPDQRVIMRAKLVTKPSSSFPPAYNSRSLVTSSRSNHQKPEQKVRPLWSGTGKAPFVAVPPTMREPQTSDQGTTTNQEKKPQQPEKSQVAQTSQSTQINQGSSKGPESPRSRSSSKAQKQSETLPPPPSSPPTAIEWKGTEFPPPDIPATLVEAPTFYPSEKDFQDPLEYIEQLTPLAQSFGICRIVPPSSFKPECKVSDDMRFTAYNQYVHKMMERWGPNVRELCAIRKYLATQSITLVQLPMIGSMEVDLPRLYQTVQQCGGLKEVIEKKRWAKVADAMRIPKSAQDRVTKLDDIYCKYLLPYDTLSHEERTKLLEEADEEWKEREKRLASDEDSGNNGSGEGSDESSEADDNIFECITKGKSMPLSVFFRIARNTMATWFKDTSPSPSEVEAEFWRHVSTKTCHVCVHCGSIDSGTWGYGFPTTKTSSTSRHPWNLKVLTNSPGSILRSLGPLMGVTVPTLHVGMLFSSCCWYRDPHALPWIEYLHTGASKIWYGVPDSRASELRKAMYPLLPRHIRDRKIWLPSDTMMVPPQFLLDGGVSLCRVVQEPGQFILVFPKAFTSSICTGYLVSESVYFAQPSWLNTAVQVFKDIQESCEPPVFSLDKLLFSIANDSRSSADILIQVLPMLKAAIEKEVESRKKLRDLGLTSWERLPSHKSGRRKKKEEEQSDMECDTCRGSLFLSVVSNSNEDCSYCIDHAIESLTKDQSLVKYCKPMFAYDEEEMEELVDKVKARIETKTQKKQKEKGVSSGTKN